MKENLSSGRRFSRRTFLKGALAGGAGVFLGDQILSDGVMMEPPPLTPEMKKISLEMLMLHGSAKEDLQISQETPKIELPEGSSVYYNRWGELIFQHENAKFDPEREYVFSHRSGNRRRMVDRAISMGVNGFDIDANDAGTGAILAEHGIVGSVDLGFMSLGAVFDADEKELRTRIPRSISSMIDYIGERSDPEDPYVLEVQLKRGKFEDIDALSDMVDAICRNRLPTKVFAADQQSINNLYFASLEYAENHLTA